MEQDFLLTVSDPRCPGNDYPMFVPMMMHLQGQLRPRRYRYPFDLKTRLLFQHSITAPGAIDGRMQAELFSLLLF